MQNAHFKEVSLTRFSALLEDLCHDQLRLTHVHKARDKDGVHLVGIKLRTPKDRGIGGFIDIAMHPMLVLQDPVESMKTLLLENAENVDYVDSFINDQISPPDIPQVHESQKIPLDISQKSTYPTFPSPSRDEAFMKPTLPYTARVSGTSQPLKPSTERHAWPFGKAPTPPISGEAYIPPTVADGNGGAG